MKRYSSLNDMLLEKQNQSDDIFQEIGQKNIQKAVTSNGISRFQNVIAASSAKYGLQGKLFGDPLLDTGFSKSETVPVGHFHDNGGYPSPLREGIGKTSGVSNEGISMHQSALPINIGVGAHEYTSPSPQMEEIPLYNTHSSSFDSFIDHIDPMHKTSNYHWSPGHFFPTRSLTLATEKPYSPSQYMYTKGSGDLKYECLNKDEKWSLDHDYKTVRDQKRGRYEMEYPDHTSLMSMSSPLKTPEKIGPLDQDGEPKRQRLGNEQSLVSASNDSNYLKREGLSFIHEPWYDQKGNTDFLGSTSVVKEEGMGIFSGSEKNSEANTGLSTKVQGGALLSHHNASFAPQADKRLDEGLIRSTHVGISHHISLPSKDLFRWEGIIAKGGVKICRCRCLPATKEIDVTFPGILDCTARTSLDMLAQYITQMKDSSVVLFMPHGVSDVAPYQELMAFLSEKHRAAVCKLSMGSTLFLVPPSDFVEQFLNVPKSNNILGVVLRQQHQSQLSQASSGKNITSNLQETVDLKKEGDHKFDLLELSEISSVPPNHSLIDSSLNKPSLMQQNEYQLEMPKIDPGPNVAYENTSGISLKRDVIDSGRLLHGTHGSKPLLVEYQAYGNHQSAVIGNSPFQIPGVSGSEAPNIIPGIKVSPYQDLGLLKSPAFIAPSIHEQQPALNVNHGAVEGQKLTGSFAIHEQPWSTVSVPHSVTTQSDASIRDHSEQTLAYASDLSQKQSFSYDGQQQDVRSITSDFVSRMMVDNTMTGTLQHARTSASEGISQTPLSGIQPAALSQGQDAQGSESDQQQAFQTALAAMQDPDRSEEDKKKFRATVELAVALLQQLQQKTKQ
ncbi:hypothetical protein KP509_05G068500 [Ceratopteris richardii]|nr:hypothetical protein KP509_05G068500 [Ceratopteris richardii]